MSINTLEFAQNMTKELDKAAGQKTVTGFLADNSLRARFVGANKVLIPEVEISGLGDYDRIPVLSPAPSQFRARRIP